MLQLDPRPGTLTIRNASCRGGPDALRTRLHLESALAGVSLPGTGRLVVRTLKLPGRVGSRLLGRAVERGLADLHAHAPRPWRDRSAASANAVLFADDLELIACFLRDWHDGRLADFWFWGSLFGDRTPIPLLHEMLQQHGASLPGAFELLAGEHIAVATAARLPDAAAEVARLAIADTYGVSLGTSIDGSPAFRSPAKSPVQAGHGNDDPAGHPPNPASASLQRRLLTLVPEIDGPRLSPVQRRLLALALGLARAPAFARGEGMRAVLEPAEAAKPAPDASPADDAMHSHATSPNEPVRGERSEPAGYDASADPHPPAGKGDQRISEIVSYSTKDQSLPTASHPGFAEGKVVHQTTSQTRPSSLFVSRMDETPDRIAETEFGGIFYLLNVALALGLYGDFSQPRHPGIALPPWDFLALAGQRWFGAAFTSDPVWPCLAQLAGRGNEPPGKGFRRPADWQVPPGWLDPWGEPAWIGVAATRVRLVLLHPAGFAFAQTTRPDGETPMEAARALCQHYPMLERVPLVRSQLRSLPRGATSRWMALLLDTVLARLAMALGVLPAETTALLCRHPAVLRLSQGRLDVRLSLADLPIAIRMAGLDRDPGWIPASGHTIAFRFE